MKQDYYHFSHTGERENFNSATAALENIAPFFKDIQTVLDLGGGMGAWSAALSNIGVKEVWLVDHPLVDANHLLIEDKSRFIGIDLDKQLPPVRKYDLSVCIEVLEHFEEKRAIQIHQFLCESADLILFSAAIPGQNGLGHLNCQRHAYWHDLFHKNGFRFFDGFKSGLLQNTNIHYWIRQNLFLYYKPEQSWRFDGLANLTNSEFELVHQRILNRKIGIKEYLKLVPKVFFKK